MSNLHTVELRLTAENHIVSRKDLCIDHKLQMRTQMQQETVEQYADNIVAILKEHPIDVVVVTTAIGELWYVVDGFHRYHAAVFADVEEVNIRLMKGTYEDAVQYAMSANWENGLRPNKDDAQRSIGILLETMPDFGYDSKKVIPWLETFGIPKSTARNNTKKLREDIDDKRDAAVLSKHNAGLSSREIEAETGINYKTAQRIIEAGTNEPVAQMSQEDSCPFDPESDPAPFFDEDDCDITPAINPVDALNKALAEQEEERKETTRQQDNSAQSSPVIRTNANSDQCVIEKIKAVLRASGIYEDHTKAEVNAALFAISQGN